MNQVKEIHPLLQTIIDRLIKSGAGEVVVAEDGHVFFQPSVYIKHLWGAAEMKEEGRKAGVHVIIRKINKRGRRCKYAGLPWFQIYVLPIVQKNAKTMTDKERRNMELNVQALRMAHAVERDPVKAAYYHKLHEAHKRNPVGYKKLYPNFFGFVYATIRMELVAQEAARQAAAKEAERHEAEGQGLHTNESASRSLLTNAPMCIRYAGEHIWGARTHVSGARARPIRLDEFVRRRKTAKKVA